MMKETTAVPASFAVRARGNMERMARNPMTFLLPAAPVCLLISNPEAHYTNLHLLGPIALVGLVSGFLYSLWGLEENSDHRKVEILKLNLIISGILIVATLEIQSTPIWAIQFLELFIGAWAIMAIWAVPEYQARGKRSLRDWYKNGRS